MIFLFGERKNINKDIITKKDIIILIILYLISIISAIFTYDGALCLLSVFATMIYSFSVWQKDTIRYKFLGIPSEGLWLLYNIYIKSIFGIILEGILLISSINGYRLENKRKYL